MGSSRTHSRLMILVALISVVALLGVSAEEACASTWVYKGHTYEGCTRIANLLPWCAFDPIYQLGRWKLCDEDDPGFADVETCAPEFEYNGVTYTECVMGYPHSPWCAIDAVYQTGQWITCDATEVEGEEQEEEEVEEVEEEEEEEEEEETEHVEGDCYFPFEYRNKVYWECANIRNNGVPWCSLNHTYDGHWKNCTDADYCTIPYTYRGVEYDRCTSVNNEGVPWCARDATYIATRWHVCFDVPPCVFPFTYEGITYTTCTSANTQGQLWCALDADNPSKDWRDCDDADTEGNEPTCDVPFDIDGVEYDSCTTRNNEGTYWCPLDSTNVAQDWINCCDEAPSGDSVVTTGGPVPEGTPCVFPFTYRNQEYNACTTLSNDGDFWCATQTNYAKDAWGNCALVRTECPEYFTYKGQNVTRCTRGSYHVAWCGLDVDYQNKQWAPCVAQCPDEN